MSKFQKVKIVQITQGQNKHADSLATLASSLIDEISQLIKVEVVQEPNIYPKVNISAISLPKLSWMDLIIEFLAKNHLLSKGKEAKGCVGVLLGSGCLRTVGCIKDLLEDLISCASILPKLTIF